MQNVLSEKDKTLISHHTGVLLRHTYKVFGITFECDMREKYSLTMFNNCQNTHDGIFNKNKFGYILKHNNQVIFHGYDLGVPSMPESAIEYLKVIQSILVYLSLEPGEIEEDYFKDYTKRQLQWAEKHAESLSGFNMSLHDFVYEPEDKENYEPAIESFFCIEQDYILTTIVNASELRLTDLCKQIDFETEQAYS